MEELDEFWNPRWVYRPWRDLEGTLRDLIAAYGRKQLGAALKRINRSGAPPIDDDIKLRVFIGRHCASYLDGTADRLANNAIKNLWAAEFPEDEPETRRQQAHRVLKERQVLGLAFAVNERWHKMSEARRRLAHREISTLPKLHSTIRNLALSLADGDVRELEEAPTSKGLVPDARGLPRLKRKMKYIADELVPLAFRHGHLVD